MYARVFVAKQLQSFFSSSICLRVLLACQLSINLINIPAILYCYLSKMKEEADIVLTVSIRFINFFFYLMAKYYTAEAIMGKRKHTSLEKF